MTARLAHLDLARGWLMAHMAFDHANFLLGDSRFSETPAGVAFREPASLAQFVARQLGTPVAPGFMVLAGVGASLKLARDGAAARGDLVKRAGLLVGVDLAMSLPDILLGAWGFDVLTAAALALLAVAALHDRVSNAALGALAVVLVVSPELMSRGGLTGGVAEVLALGRVAGPRVSYPVLPWLGLALVGAFAARRGWLAGSARAGLALVVLGAALQGLTARSGSWFERATFSRYPPSVAYVAWNLGWFSLVVVAARRLVERRASAPLLRAFADLGASPLLFYVVHFSALFALSLAGLRVRDPLGIALVAGVVTASCLPLARALRAFKRAAPLGLRRLL